MCMCEDVFVDFIVMCSYVRGCLGVLVAFLCIVCVCVCIFRFQPAGERKVNSRVRLAGRALPFLTPWRLAEDWLAGGK